MIHEPVDLKFDSWFPTDWLSANLRHTVTAIFSHASMSVTPATAVTPGDRRARRRSRTAAMQSESALISVPQSMEIDQLSDGEPEPFLRFMAGLPDGSFACQKYKFWYILEDLDLQMFGVLHVHLL
jgi:hypothetical protein